MEGIRHKEPLSSPTEKDQRLDIDSLLKPWTLSPEKMHTGASEVKQNISETS